MRDFEIAGLPAVEVIRDRLYFAAVTRVPRSSVDVHFFCTDAELVYESFFADFGPLNLSMVYRYCKMLETKLTDPALSDARIVHYCSSDPKMRCNAACLICLFQVAVLGKTAEQAWEPFANVQPPFLPFRDASCGICTFHLTIIDCLRGLEEAIRHRWFDVNRFDVDSYEFFEKVENGDMNWIVPNKFLAFAGPCPTPTDAEGFPAFTPEDYVPIFHQGNIGLVVRLNRQQYDRRRFIDRGIKHADLYFLDGSCPSRDITAKFMHITESEPGAVAVHCKAGLGRTGTLIGLYAMKHYRFPARAFIGWNRICRPGSILGPQQQFLVDMQNDMFQAAAAMRRPAAPLSGGDEVQQRPERLSIQQAVDFEDVGQGERLCSAKRSVRESRSGGASPAETEGSSPTAYGRLPGGSPRNSSRSESSGGTHSANPAGPAATAALAAAAAPASGRERRPSRSSFTLIPSRLRGMFSSR